MMTIRHDAPTHSPRLSRRCWGQWAAAQAAVCLLPNLPASAAKPAAIPWRQFAEQAGKRSGRQREIDAALSRAAKFLVDHQSRDGSWRSEEYGALRDGMSLTPTICTTLYYLPQGGRRGRAAFDLGRQFLLDQIDKQGQLDTEFYPYPIYSAATASWVVMLGGQDEAARAAQKAWVKFIRARQFNEALGWKPQDDQYGGWGYSVRAPRKLASGDVLAPESDANVSATLFALGALSSAAVPLDDPAILAARQFVARCQNFATDKQLADTPAGDGGFCFSPTDAARNKAGAIDLAKPNDAPFRSYGSATADGLRALLRSGFEPKHPRVVAARAWLREHFRVDHNPGDFPESRLRLRDSYYYYYCWSTAHAWMHLGEGAFEQTRDGERRTVDWRKQLATVLLERQTKAGGWVNRFRDAKEDDPLVATPLAAAALAICRFARDEY